MTHPDHFPGRTGLIVASSASILTLLPVALHQFGAIRHLPDPPFAAFDSDTITCSQMAHPFGIPDGVLGLASYGTTLGLALAATESSALKRTLAAKIAFDGGLAAVNTVRQIVRFRKICSWCMGTVATSAISLWLARKLLRQEI